MRKWEMSGVKFGVQASQGNTTWPELLDLWRELDQDSEFDYLWLVDHFVPGQGTAMGADGPHLEGWTALAALAQATERARIGPLVTGNTYRHPAVLAKMATTVDHISNGRLEFGLGAAWHEYEHEVFGIRFPPVRERLERLEEAAHLIKLLWTEPRPQFEGQYYQLKEPPYNPPNVQQPAPAHRYRRRGRKADAADGCSLRRRLQRLGDAGGGAAQVRGPRAALPGYRPRPGHHSPDNTGPALPERGPCIPATSSARSDGVPRQFGGRCATIGADGLRRRCEGRGSVVYRRGGARDVPGAVPADAPGVAVAVLEGSDPGISLGACCVDNPRNRRHRGSRLEVSRAVYGARRHGAGAEPAAAAGGRDDRVGAGRHGDGRGARRGGGGRGCGRARGDGGRDTG